MFLISVLKGLELFSSSSDVRKGLRLCFLCSVIPASFLVLFSHSSVFSESWNPRSPGTCFLSELRNSYTSIRLILMDEIEDNLGNKWSKEDKETCHVVKLFQIFKTLSQMSESELKFSQYL